VKMDVPVKIDKPVNDHGYTGKSLRKKCECEMCQKGLATSHNDESHDQSLMGQFILESHPSFKLQLVGGSTKCGRIMANYFASLVSHSDNNTNIFQDKNILEVGAGTGIVGFTLAYLGAKKVMMTDQSYVLEVLEENANQNFESYLKLRSKIEIGELVWATEEHMSRYKDISWDFIIGSDLIYAKEGITPLVQTFEYFTNVKSSLTQKYPIIYMAIIRRFEWEQLFFDLMAENFTQIKLLEDGDIILYEYQRKEDKK